ncbi:hypothetical protein Asppvi_002478 [Aspergillus pseudoviridinutans]|uniref:Uncharacterized protein n=1 Tax=Aspergillus pseudoviridinutans TaxID=1517512 RepID=A0A9P3ES37_9EURO|nr:uncharacterized protein Asppvi_002478 [Aspergillus pseudoviridinutans]GIJ83648.1 hypothetical protein Asppvi_002478 [Aspergillus pseudoviridinutans]
MKFTYALLAAALAAGATAKEKYICETSDGSPYLHHVNELIDNLKNAPQGENLCNPTSNGCGGTNRGYSGGGGAAFMICGFRCSGDPGGMACAGAGCGGIYARLVGNWFEGLRDECVRPDSNGDDRVGGIVDFNDGAQQLKLFTLH